MIDRAYSEYVHWMLEINELLPIKTYFITIILCKNITLLHYIVPKVFKFKTIQTAIFITTNFK
jgi:hypothetical protein